MKADRTYKASYRPEHVTYDVEVEMTLFADEQGKQWIVIKDGDDITIPFAMAKEFASIIEDWRHYRG